MNKQWRGLVLLSLQLHPSAYFEGGLLIDTRSLSELSQWSCVARLLLIVCEPQSLEKTGQRIQLASSRHHDNKCICWAMFNRHNFATLDATDLYLTKAMWCVVKWPGYRRLSNHMWLRRRSTCTCACSVDQQCDTSYCNAGTSAQSGAEQCTVLMT